MSNLEIMGVFFLIIEPLCLTLNVRDKLGSSSHCVCCAYFHP